MQNRLYFVFVIFQSSTYKAVILGAHSKVVSSDLLQSWGKKDQLLRDHSAFKMVGKRKNFLTHRWWEGEEQQESCRCKKWWSHVTLCCQWWSCPVEWRRTLPPRLFIWPRTLAQCLRTSSNTNIPLTQLGQSNDSYDSERSFPRYEVCDWWLKLHL